MKLTILFTLLLGWFAPHPHKPQAGEGRIENFSLVNALNNKTVSLSDFGGERAVVCSSYSLTPTLHSTISTTQ